MLRPLAAAALTAFCVPALFTSSADASATSTSTASSATPTAVYGFAWADGTGVLRVLPVKATLNRRSGPPRYTFSPIPGAKERRIDYSRAEFRRVTSACDLKETEGVVKVDAKGLGTTRCKPADLAFALGLGPTPVKISLGAKKRVYEVLALPGSSKTAYGTIRRVNDTTVLFTRGKKSIRLGYTALTFTRTTRSCGSPWLADRSNAQKNGLGRKDCTGADFTKALKALKRPVLAKIDYTSLSNQLNQVWEFTPAR
ncbi:hypothetical protein Sme01_06930 [Sphaerisporangium melleum]|uniref:Lipoprotein n=1 Tax=Sphaerisporangium melleum TaxID=321316 RepID=A0A917QWA8_9ACTN|nr:hypothetical protein [Sphaerisporangium melleum]GGK73412.1 hypothetical protein GCM10007964_15270 [Sphaerisporangium melleum]GII68217.1 hypothetical protein Sme01_06930 [Sphaerisporangium melleum]